MAPGPTLSVIVLTPTDVADLTTWHQAVAGGLEAAGWRAQFVYALSDRAHQSAAEIARLSRESEVHAVLLTHWFNEASAIQRALDVAKGDLVLTLPVGGDVAPEAVPLLLDHLGEGDGVLAVRSRDPARGSDLDLGGVPARGRDPERTLGHRLLGLPFADPGCRTRLFRREVLSDPADRSTSFALLPRLAAWHGRTIGQVALPPTRRPRPGLATPGLIVGALLLDLTLGFARRPLQLFGVVGAASVALGLAITLPPVVARLLGLEALASQPTLIPGLLLIALAIQCAALGLVAELLVFARRRNAGERVVADLVD